MNTIEEITTYLKERANGLEPLHAGLKFQFPEGVVYIDGNAENEISNADNAADCTLKLDMETFNGIREKQIDPMSAAMSGKVQIDGNLQLALKIVPLI